MSRVFDNTAGKNLSCSTPVTGPPFTVACWYRRSVRTDTDHLINIGAVGSNNQRYSLYGTTTGALAVLSRTTTTSPNATTTAVADDGNWHHACGVFASTSDRRVFLDGGNKATNTTANAPNAATDVILGENPGGTDPHSGEMQWPAIWNVALTDAEVAALGAGADPRTIRPGALVFFAPHLGRDTADIDIIGGRTLTNTGAVAVSDSEPSVRPARLGKLRLPKPPASGVAGRRRSVFTANTTSHAVGIPAGVVSGDLLLMGAASCREAVQTTPSGWTLLGSNLVTDGTIYIRHYVYARIADGSEGATVDVVTDTARTMAAHVYRIVGFNGTIADDIDINNTTNYNSSTGSIPSVTAGWGEGTNLYVNFHGSSDDNGRVTIFPADGYGNFLETPCPAGVNASVNIQSGYKIKTGTGSGSDSPSSVWTFSEGEAHVGFLVVVNLTDTGGTTGDASGSLPTATLTAPAGAATGEAAASGALPALVVLEAEATGSGGAEGSGTLSTISITAPEATATGGTGGLAEGAIGTVTVSPPQAAASGGATAAGDNDLIVMAAPEATAGGGAGASGALATVGTSPPAGGATGGAEGSGAVGTVTLTPPAGSAEGSGASGSGEGAIGTVAVSPPQGAASGTGTAAGALATVTISAPQADAQGGVTGAGPIGTVGAAAPEGSGSGGATAAGAGATIVSSPPDGAGAGGATGQGGGATATLSPPQATATGGATAAGGGALVLLIPPAGYAGDPPEGGGEARIVRTPTRPLRRPLARPPARKRA